MDEQEIRAIFGRMGAVTPEGTFQRGTLMQDPILLNRYAVEVLQKIDRDKTKFQAVVSPNDEGVFFGFSVACAAWVKFGKVEGAPGALTLPEGFELDKRTQVLVAVETTDDAEMVQALVNMVESAGAKPIAIVALYANKPYEFDLPTFTLVG